MVRKYKVIPLGLLLSKIFSDWNQLLMDKNPIRNITFVPHEILQTVLPNTLFFLFLYFYFNI